MLLTAHVQTVAAFRDDVQSEAGKHGEANSNFPHKFSPKNNVTKAQFFNWGQININLVNRSWVKAKGAERFLVLQYEEAPLAFTQLRLEINVDLTPIKKALHNGRARM
jgi:hypothetical protein